MSGDASRRLLVGVEGPELSEVERRLFARLPPHGFLLLPRNLVSAEQTVRLTGELRALTDPAPLLYVDQEGGPVDRLGPLLGVHFPSPTRCASLGSDRVHSCAYLMGRAARILGFDVDLAPSVDLGPPDGGGIVLSGRTFGFHAEDVILSGLVFVHGLARAGIASCLKHFPGLGRGTVDSHDEVPVIDAHDVDLMVTDVAPFVRLAGTADGILVGHGAYPGFGTGATPASLSARLIGLVRATCRFEGVVFSDDLTMKPLPGAVPDRVAASLAAGTDVALLAHGLPHYEAAVDLLEKESLPGEEPRRRLSLLAERAASSPRPPLDSSTWLELGEEVRRLLRELDEPRPRRGLDDPFA